ncbi:MAG: hypothetical protein ACM3PU_08955, partial [Gemmatimonadota bacterium]
VPGAIIGGWLGEHLGLRAGLVFAGTAALLLAAAAWRQPRICRMRELPAVDSDLAASAGQRQSDASTPGPR